MESWNTFVKTPYRVLNGKESIAAEYGMHYIKGNPLPYFAITGTIREESIFGGSKIVGGGCCHGDIAKTFTELAPLIPFHLCDSNGLPMHYIANAVYWAELVAGISKWQKGPHYHKQSFIEILSDHCLCGVLGDRNELNERMKNYQSEQQEFVQWLQSRVERLQNAFNKTMQTHNVRMTP